MEPVIKSIQSSVINGNKSEVVSLVSQALDFNISANEILNGGLIAAMKEVGSRFEAGDFYIPEMLIAARSMQAGLAILKPLLISEGIQSSGKVVIGTVKGDLHDIGKNLVAIMLEGAGYEIIDLGTDVEPEKFVMAIMENDAKLVGMSALLTTTMNNMRVVIDAIKNAGLRDQVKVIVGGAPLTERFAMEIGADGYAPDAGRAPSLAKIMLDG